MKSSIPRVSRSTRRAFVAAPDYAMGLTPFRSVVISLALVFAVSVFTFRADSHEGTGTHAPLTGASSARTDEQALPAALFYTEPRTSRKVAGSPGPIQLSPPTATIFLAGVEQFGLGSGQIDLFTVTLGGNTAGSDTFTVGTPATLATTNSTNENKPDINNPVDIRFDKSGDLLIANGGTSNADPGSFACVPAGAVTTGANSSTTITQAGTNPTAFGHLAYDARDGSAAIANNPVSSSTQLFEYLLSGSYSAAGAPRNLIAPGFGATAVTEVPSLAAGTYAVALQTGTGEDPTCPGECGAHGNNKVALFSPTGAETDITDDTTFSIDAPYGLAFDSQNNQLVVANNSVWHKLLSFYNVSPVSLVKTINTGFKNTYTATSPDGHVAVAWVKQLGDMQVQVYDNTAARAPVFGPIPYNGTTTSCGSTYIYGNGAAIVNGLKWLSNTKLLVAVQSNNSGTPTAKNGFYIYDITNSEVPAGFDDATCSAFAAAPINTGFQHIGTHPFGVAIRGGTFVFADPSANTTTHVCNGNSPCYPTITEAIAALPSGGVVNVFGGTYNDSVNLNNSNVTVNIDGNTTVHAFTLTAGILNAGAGNCGQAGSFTLTLDTGNWTNNGGTFNPGSGTVAFNGSSAQTIGGNPTTFNNLTISNAAGVNLSNSETVGGTLTLTNGALGVGTNTLTLNGGVTFTSGTITSGATGTVNYNQSSGGQNIAPGNYGNLTFSNFTKTLPNGSTVKIAGTFTTGAAGGHTLTGSTVEFNGTTGAQALPATFSTYNNLTLNNAGGTSGFNGLNVQGLMHVANGAFTIDNSTFNNVTIDTTLTGTSGKTINVSGAWANNGTFTANGNTVTFNGSSAQSIGGSSNTNFNNLTINNTSGGVGLNSSQTVAGTLTLTSGLLSIGANTLTLGGAISGAGSSLSAASGTVNYNQLSNGQAVIAANYGNLTFSDFTKTLPNGATVKIAGSFTTGATGGHTLTGSTIEFNGGSAQTLPSTFTTYNNLTLNGAATGGFDGLIVQGLLRVQAGSFNSGSATLKDVQIDLSRTLLANGSSALGVSGNWLNNGTFTANSSTVSFNGNNNTQTISGSTASPFYNLTSAHTGTNGVALGADNTINNTLTLTSDLDASTFTLTMPATASSTGAGDVTGNVKRLFPGTLNTVLSFGNPNNQITINGGTAPANIIVNLVKAAPSDFTGAVKRKYTITSTGGSGISATLRLHYNDADLNSNNESYLDLWRFAGSWASQGHTTRDANANWVELSGVTAFSPWAIATHVNQPPAVTGASTFVNVQTSSGLVVTPASGDVDVTYFKISNITNGTLFKHDGTPISAGNFITVAEGAAGLKFTPTTDFSGNGSFDAQSSFDNSGTGLSSATTTSIPVNKYNTSTTINSDSPDPSNQGDNVTVTYTITNTSGGPTPTGNVVVTVSGGAESCTGTVADGGCTLALTNTGNPRTITATYSANASFNGSSNTASHVVNACVPNPIITSTADSGANTLRDALTNVCSAPNNNITFNLGAGPHTITLSTGELALTRNVNISNTVGGGNGAVTISGNNSSRVFNINSGKTVTISNLTITAGFATGGFPAVEGGAIINDHGTLTLVNSAVTGSTADPAGAGSGGGIFNNAFSGGTASLTVISSTISGNTASAGGGIYSYGDGGTALVTVVNSTLSGNTAVGSGGGITSYVANGGAAPTTLINVTLSGNKAGLDGGGIENSSAVLTVVNGTIAGNRADNNDDNSGAGGGIHTNINTFNLKNTIVALNFNKSTGSAADDVSGTLDSASAFNLIGTGGAGGLTNGTNSNQVGVASPGLGPLANNGGLAQTLALLPNSPAIEAGSNALLPADTFDLNNNSNTAEALPVDQRGTGFSRVVNTTVDIGAFEANYGVTATSGTPQSATINTAFATQLQATVTESGNPASGIPVTFTAPSGATASGAFSGPATNTNASGVSTASIFTANGIAGGPYNVVATIGNGQPTASFALTNLKANQLITVGTHAPGSAAYHASFTVAATSDSGLTVSYSSSGACSNVGATFTMTSSTGTCTAKYDQAGDANHNAATQVTESVNAQKASQTITVGTHAPASAAYNTTFTVAATSNSGLAVVYSSSGACSNAGSLFTMTSSTGTCTVKYDQAGDSNYNAATQVTESVNAQKASQTITVGTHAPSSALYNTSFSVAATSNSGLAVAYSSSGSCTNVGAVFTMTSGTGACTVKYDQAGDANYLAASQVMESVNAQKASQTVTVGTHAPATAVYNTNFTVAATSTSGLAVAYSSSGACTNVGAVFTISSGTGACTVKYDQAGNTNYTAATQVTESVNAQKATQTITVGTHAPASAAYNANFTVGATSSSGLAVAYSSSGSCTNVGAVFTVNSSTGVCTVKYDQAGNANYNAASQVTESVNAQKAGQSITFGALPQKSVGDPDFTVSATSTSALAVSFAASGQCTVSGATVHLTSAGSCTITASQAGDANYNAASDVPQSFNIANRPLISFSQANYSVNESAGFVTVTVNRTADLSVPVTVDYATDDTGASSVCGTLNSGLASSRCDFGTTLGTLKFAATETQKTFVIPITQDSFTEGPEMFTVNLSNLTGTAAFATPSGATVTINDSTAPTANAIDDTDVFVRQQYRDFLNREADAPGLQFWTNQINGCGSDTVCRDAKRVNVSAAFFLSIEFQTTGNLVRNFYVAALDRPATNNMPGFAEFERDTQAMQRGLIVGQGNWQQTLSDNRDAFMRDFVTRAEFVGLYPTTDTPTQYVDKLYSHAGIISPPPTERNNAIAEFGSATTAADPGARGRALIDVTQYSTFQNREMNRSFVQMEYFGYLRRNPNDAPDGNFAGYDFWVNKLTTAGGDFVKADMVKAFITSTEYRRRFGPN